MKMKQYSKTIPEQVTHFANLVYLTMTMPRLPLSFATLRISGVLSLISAHALQLEPQNLNDLMAPLKYLMFKPNFANLGIDLVLKSVQFVDSSFYKML